MAIALMLVAFGQPSTQAKVYTKPCLELPSPDKEECMKQAEEKLKRDLHDARDKYIEDRYKACLMESDGLRAELAAVREELAAARKK
jgi:hypothetical protein